MKFKGIVTVIKNGAAYGPNRRSSGSSFEGVLQIQTRRNGRQELVLSSETGICAEYDVRNIADLRNERPVATIKIKQPAPPSSVTLLLRECEHKGLAIFMDYLRKLRKDYQLVQTLKLKELEQGSNAAVFEEVCGTVVKKVSGSISFVYRLENDLGCGTDTLVFFQGVVHIRKGGDGRKMLVVSTRKQIYVQDYNRRNMDAFSGHLFSERSAMIKIMQPPVNIFLRNCDPEELAAFMDYFKNSRDQEMLVRSASSSSHSGVQLPASLVNTTKKAKLQEILPSIVKISIHSGYSQLDQRFLQTKNLTSLDLSRSALKNITELGKLQSSLLSLILSRNQITEIPDGLFNAPPFRNLQNLDLSENQLTILPSSILNLCTLMELNISDNQIRNVPYNWMRMKRLRKLKISNNRLACVPATIRYLYLSYLDVSDNPDVFRLRAENVGTPNLGYSGGPTLFDMACEVVSNVQFKNRATPGDNLLLPSHIQSYLKEGGNYCIRCFRKTFQGKVVKEFDSFSSFFSGPDLCGGIISPALAYGCIEKVVCPTCNEKGMNGRRFNNRNIN